MDPHQMAIGSIVVLVIIAVLVYRAATKKKDGAGDGDAK